MVFGGRLTGLAHCVCGFVYLWPEQLHLFGTSGNGRDLFIYSGVSDEPSIWAVRADEKNRSSKTAYDHQNSEPTCFYSVATSQDCLNGS